MSKQPHIEPPDTPPVSSRIAMFMSEFLDELVRSDPAMFNVEPEQYSVPAATLRQWLTYAGSWERLAAEFQAARNEDGVNG